jgi:DNA-binding CsgD family transcriptional regulator
LERVVRAQQVLLGVLDHPTAESWMRAVADELKGLFGAEQALLTLALPSGYTLYTDLDEGAQRSYLDHYYAVDNSGEMVASLADPFSTEEDRHGEAHDRFLAGELYNEWYLPNGLDRSVSLVAYGRAGAAPMTYERYPDALLGNVHLSGAGVARGKGAARGRTMLALLQPALAASARALQDVVLGAASVADGLAVPAWLFDAGGRCVHESTEAARLVDSLPDGNALRTAAGHLVGRALSAVRSGAPCPPSAGLTVGGRALTLTWAPLDTGPVPGLVVRVEGAPTGGPSEGALRDRFGLTRQQARVALLLASRRSTTEIAGALSVSVHTVRRHTEGVLEKLGVSSRRDIEGALTRLPPGGHERLQGPGRVGTRA